MMNTVTEDVQDIVPKQRRSRARRAAMIEQGAVLLNQRDLDELPVADITATLGYSTGSFYSSFKDKEAFFVAVQRAVNDALDARIAKELEEPDLSAMGLTDRLRLCVDFTLGYFRESGGVIRCAMRYEHRIPHAWAPNRTSAQRIINAMTSDLEGTRLQAMKVAIQAAFGTIVNALLHDPGPLHLGDDTFGPALIAALGPYLDGID